MGLLSRFRDFFVRKSIRTKMLSLMLVLTALELICVLLLISMVYRNNNIKNSHLDNIRTLKNISVDMDISRENVNSFMLNVHGDGQFMRYLACLSQNGSHQDDSIYKVEAIIRNYLRLYEGITTVEVHIAGLPETRISVRTGTFLSLWTEFEEKHMPRTLASPGKMVIFKPENLNQIVFSRAQPLPGGMEGHGYYSLCIALNQSHTTQLLKRNTGNGSRQAILFLKDGFVLSRTTSVLKNYSADDLGILYGNKSDAGRCNNELGSWVYNVQYLENIDMYACVMTNMSVIDLTSRSFLASIRIILIAMVIMAMLIVIVMTQWINKPIFDLNRQFGEILTDSKRRRLQIYGSDELRSIAEGINVVLDKQEMLIRDNYRTRILEKNARIEMLQVQINPHFVFNTLDIINWFVYEKRNEEAGQVIQKLGEMMRYSTYRYKSFVTLGEELHHVHNYLYIQLIRYDSRFEVDVDVEDGLTDLKIPCLIIQPLVENAVKYGAACKDSDGRIAVSAMMKEKTLMINVFDNGPGMTQGQISRALGAAGTDGPEDERTGGIGLKNVNERMKLLFGAQYAVTIESEPGYFTQVTIRLPFRGDNNEDHHC